MRFSIFLGLTGVAALSVLATVYTLPSENADAGLATSAHEQELQQEIDRLHQTVESLKAGLDRIGSNPRLAGAPPAVSPAQTTAAASLTTEQKTFVENIQLRFNDPSFVRTLNLSELTKMGPMQSLPDPLRQALIAKALEKYNRGEVDEQTFLAGMKGYPR